MTGAAPEQRSIRPIAGAIAGVVAGALLAGALYLAVRDAHPESGMLLFSVVLIAPAACALAVFVAGIRAKSRESAATLSAVVVTVLLIGGGLIFREGVICLMMAAPIFYPLGLLAGVCTKYLRNGNTRASIAIFVLAPAILMPFEQNDAYPTFQASVVSSIEIDAPVESVWRHAIEIRDIRSEENTWTLSHDVLRIPKPVDARLARRDGGLVREATWRNAVEFYEIVTEWREQRSVAWTFEVPEDAADRLLDEHLRLDQDYLQLRSGRYDVEALSPTRTRLTLTTSYAARTPFNAYAEAWGDILLGDIHRNVLNIVRQRAEAGDKPS